MVALLVLVLLQLHPTASHARRGGEPPMALPGCPDRCGDLTVPYPFGLLDGCSHGRGFLLTCNNTFQPPALFINTPSQDLLRVSSLTSDDLTIFYTKLLKHCDTADLQTSTFDLGDLPYIISPHRNKITVIGCDSMGVFTTHESFITGCFSFCSNTSVSTIANGTCSGEGCCEAPLRKGSKKLEIFIRSIFNYTTTRNISNCSAAFPVQQNWYNFSYRDVVSFDLKEVPVVLDWSVGNQTCAVAKRSDGYACVGGEGKTRCEDSTGGDGYRCYCVNGYHGNPYISDGCEDIDECSDSDANNCTHICRNSPGSYQCSCPKGMYGDGRRGGRGCTKSNPHFPVQAQIALGVALSSTLLLLLASLLWWARRKRRYILLRESYFRKNGGMLLQQQLPAGDAARIFTEEELRVATASYHESRVLGRGGNGTVYKGFLPDKGVVAIKKSRAIDDQMELEQFLNEILVLGKVIHKSVVKMVGCCLETEVPLLVYEYIPNGTLFEHIHPKDDRPSKLSWETRLCIASDTAGAIAYLHSDLKTPIIHRDIKSANILLDGDFTAKVADFGASRLAPSGELEVATMVKGTLGYLDPEYFQTGNLTDKSDVYSFGVVLAELLTGLKPISFFPPPCPVKNLAIYFLLMVKEGSILDIIEANVREEASREHVMAVAEITKKCLALRGEERPSMKEVAAQLEKLRGYGGWRRAQLE